VGGREVLQTLRINTEDHIREQVICPNEKREITGNKVLETEERAWADGNVPIAL
jgi:hypothetical protein